MIGLRQVGVGDANDHVHFAALQFGTNPIAKVQFGET